MMLAQRAWTAQSPFPPTSGITAPATTTTTTASAAAGASMSTTTTMEGLSQTSQRGSKRKAESQDNERLSKRLSLLNIEQNGPKLYVPVEAPSTRKPRPTVQDAQSTVNELDDSMHVEDSKHKVYIYNLDDELSSDNDSDDGKLVFLPDIQKHLRQNRIPQHILANSDGELAGMQMVLYSDPKSLTVPEEQDSVHKAIAESRQRLREKLRRGREGDDGTVAMDAAVDSARACNGSPNATVEQDDDVMEMD